MFNFNKDKVEVNIDFSSLTKSAIPLLIEDEKWKKLFGEIKEKEIVNLKTELKELVDESRKIRKEIPIKKSEKKKLISKILTLSEKINNNELTEGIDLLENYKEELNSLNEEIEDLSFKSETVPTDVRQANLNLLIETIKYAYLDIMDTENKLEDIDAELKELRKRLKDIIVAKYDYEENRNEIYQFLHDVLGATEVDKLDRDILD